VFDEGGSVVGLEHVKPGFIWPASIFDIEVIGMFFYCALENREHSMGHIPDSCSCTLNSRAKTFGQVMSEFTNAI
jgi:hypothetical protein